jgi:hypothetical protein
MNFPKTRKAAAAVSRDKKALAEALYLEIPPQGPGRKKAESDEQLVKDELAQAAELLAQDGYDYAVKTLTNYRATAAWVAGKGPAIGSIPWRDVSFSVHAEAYVAGLHRPRFDSLIAKYEKKGEKLTVNALRQEVGRTPKDRKGLDEIAEDDPGAIAEALTKNPKAAEKVVEHLTEELKEARAGASRGAQKNMERREAEGDRKFREAVGDELADGLEWSEELGRHEKSLLNAHSWIAGFTRNVSPELIEEAPDAWKESCLQQLDWIDGHVQIARSLLDGQSVDDGLRELLAEEGSK